MYSSVAVTTTSYQLDTSTYDKDATLTFYVVANCIADDGTTQSITSTTESKNMFVYPTAPTALTISNVARDGNTVSMTVNFTQPTELGSTGFRQFIIENGDGYSETVAYVGSSYNVAVSFTQEAASGTIKVYLQNTDTNSSAFMDGASSTIQYNSTVLTLDSVDYLIYTGGGQKMNLSWNSVVADGWTVNNYTVYYNVNGGSYSSVAVTTTSYQLDTSDLSIYVKGAALSFYVVANCVATGTTQSITSNNESKNMFVYATAPTSGRLNWAAADASKNTMDINVQFMNPSDTGYGSIVGFTVSVGGVTKSVAYNTDNSYLYLVDMLDLTYSASGDVVIALVTNDTNDNGQLTGASTTTHFVSSQTPIIIDASSDGRTLTFKGVSETPLTKIGTVHGIVLIPSRLDVTYEISNQDFYSIQNGSTNVFEYVYTIDLASTLGASFVNTNSTYVINIGNDVGVSTKYIIRSI
jgi:hypothetical protein